MAENHKLSISRRDFMRLSALSITGAALASGLGDVLITYAQDTETFTYTMAGRDTDVKFSQMIVDAFNAEMQAASKPYRVTITPGPATDNDFVTKLNLDWAGGTAADIVDADTFANYEDAAAAGYLVDLTDMLNGWDQWANWIPVIKDLLQVNGKIYGLSNATAFTLFYRKDVLAQAGISAAQPQTWDDFYTICDNIATKLPGVTPAGIPAARPWGAGAFEEGFRHVWLGFAENTDIFDQSDNKWVVSSDGLLKALTVYQTLAKNKWLTVESLLSPNPWEPIKYQGFVQGTVMVVTGGDWQWQFDWGPNGQAPITDIYNKVDRWLFPSSVSKPFPFTAVGGGLLTISTSAKDIPGAFEYLKAAFLPKDTCKALEYLFSGPSALTNYADSCPYYNTGVDGKMLEASKMLLAGRYIFEGPGASQISDGIGLATEQVITLAQTPQQAMDAFASSMTDALGADAVKTL